MRRFFVVISAWNKICKNCSILFLFRRHHVFSIISLRGLLVCSSKVPVLFSHMVFLCRLMSFINAIQLYFLCQGVFRSRFFASSDRFLTRLHYLQKRGNSTCGETYVKGHYTQFTCVPCSLSGRRDKSNCF